MGIQILLNIQAMNTAIILTFLGLFGSLTDACCKHNCGGSCNCVNYPCGCGRLGRMGSVITDDTIEPLAYAVCNTDGADGLSWREVEACEALYCEDLPFDYPTKADYVFFNADINSVLYVPHISVALLFFFRKFFPPTLFSPNKQRKSLQYFLSFHLTNFKKVPLYLFIQPLVKLIFGYYRV